MGIVSWLILGLVAGIIAKWLMPGKDGGGLIRTTLLGVAGSFLGGFGGSYLGLGTVQAFSLMGLVCAVVGAFLILFIVKVVY